MIYPFCCIRIEEEHAVQELRWGLVGCGDIVKRCVGPALNSLASCELIAVSRNNHLELKNCANLLGATKTYKNWRDLVQDETIEAVYIATPVHLHSEQTILAAEAGKHILCEKPMAITLQACKSMIDACRHNGVHLGVAYYRHFYPVIQRIKEILASAVIGQVMLVQIDAYETRLFSGDHPRHWIFEKEKAGGGCLMDFGCHRIELLLNLLGTITEVKGLTAKIYPQHEVEDVAAVLFEFENGATGVLTLIRGGTQDRDRVYIQGTGGFINVNSLKQGDITLATCDGEQHESLPPCENAHLPLIESFTNSILSNRIPDVDGVLGLKVQKIIEFAYNSSRLHQRGG